MKKTTIIPGLAVSETMYEAASAGIAAHAPELAPLPWEQFTSPGGWWLIPDDSGSAYKAELVLRQDSDRTVKVNLWNSPDRRGAAAPKPHSHPWAFTAHILAGGYAEDRYTLTGNQVHTRLGVTHLGGSTNSISHSDYHEVTEIHEPGRTLSLMVCGPGERGAWGYLDTDHGRHVPHQPDPKFLVRLRAVNPHQP